MKHYLVTLSPRDPELLGQMSGLLRHEHHLWSEEFDEGLFFVSSEMDAGEIHSQIGNELELQLGDTTYVIELGGTFAGSGTTKVIRALTERVKQL